MVEEDIPTPDELLDVQEDRAIAFLLQQCSVTYEKQGDVTVPLIASRLLRTVRKKKKLGEAEAFLQWGKRVAAEIFQKPEPVITHILSDVNLPIYEGKITALIGPSGAGKSTILKMMNRMLELVYDKRKEPPKISGEVFMAGENGYQDLYSTNIDPIEVRRRIGMVFQQPNPLPGTIYKNVITGPRQILGLQDKKQLDAIGQTALEMAYLWDEVKLDWKKKKATRLSGGQQQRLCIARALAMGTKTLLMDEPCSSLDPIATTEIENLIVSLKEAGYTIVIVTHKMEQAQRIADYTGVVMRLDAGGHLTADPQFGSKIVQFGPTNEVFLYPQLTAIAGFMEGKWG